jgi:hypothetical protein
MPTSPFSPTGNVYVSPRAEAFAEGALVDALAAPFSEVTTHYFRVPVAMTAGVHDIITHARHENDFPRVWREICSVLRTTISRQPAGSTDDLCFRVLVAGARPGAAKVGNRPYAPVTGPPAWTLKALIGPGDDGEPCLTVLLPQET